MAATDREKALDVALGNIEKQYGKGSVMRLGDETRAPLEVIPTGAIALDVALGLGGLPRGRVVEIYGPESSGKCLTGDTYVWTDHGMERVDEIFARAGMKASCTSRVTDVRALGMRVVNERGELETVSVLTHNNRKPTVRLQLTSGRSVTATHNHPLRVLNERGHIAWRRAGEIQQGDTMVSALFGAEEAAGGATLSEDEAVFLGYLVADGSLGEGTRNAVRFTNGDPEVAAEWSSLAESLFGATVRHYDGKEHCIFDTVLRRRLADDYGLGYENAPGKVVPHQVRTAGAKIQRAFLSALFEGDGWIDPSSTIGLGTASAELARQVQLMLYGLGIPASLYTKFDETYERDDYSVIIDPSVAHRFLDQIGFRSQRRAGQVAAHFERSRMDARFENVPSLRGLVLDLRDSIGGDRELDEILGDLRRTDIDLACSRQRLAKLVAWADARVDQLSPGARGIVEHLRALTDAHYTYESVVAVEDGGLQPTFDLMVPDTHSFLANGVLSHNTTVALHSVASAQAAGGIVAFIDAEHALDPEYARNLGVDTDALLVSQPDSGEQALEIADMLIRSGALDLIVIDSVAALVPRAEIEGEMGDSHVGLQARLMSQALRKMTGALNTAGTTAIFINQLREKIGVMFGSPETTTGGRALKFYSSVRLDVRRIETLKDGTDMVGNRTRVKVVKNKCLAEGTRVFDPVTGQTHRIEEVVDDRLPINVVAADKKGGLHARPVVSWFDQGEQEVIGLRIRGGAEIWVTPDHKVRTDRGWRLAGELRSGDRVAQPRQFGAFGTSEPVSPDEARLVGYLLGDSHVGGKTAAPFINAQPALHDDVTRIVHALGCDTRLRDDSRQLTISHRPGERNGVIELCRNVGIWGHLAPTKQIAPCFFGEDVSADVIGNLLFGLLESDGWVSREQTGALRVGFATASEQMAHQVHWLLLRFGIGSSVRRGGLVKGRRIVTTPPCWEVRVAGVDNISRFAEVVPMWGPRGTVLMTALGELGGRHRGSQYNYLPDAATMPILTYLRHRGVTPTFVAGVLGVPADKAGSGLRQMLGTPRLRRDRVTLLAEALDDPFLQDQLAEQVSYLSVAEVLPARRARTFDVEVDELHNLVAEDIVVHNCAPPFKQAEFDIMYGKGISREGGLIDVGVECGLVRKAGAWYTYEGDQLGQGKENARSFLKDNPDLANEIEKRILEKLGVTPTVDTPADGAEAAGEPPVDPDGIDF